MIQFLDSIPFKKYKPKSAMRSYSIFLFLFFFFSCSQFSVPKGFVEFDPDPSEGKSKNRIEVDFDNDKTKDVFTIIYEAKKELHQAKKYLLIYLSSHDKVYYIDFDIFNGVFDMPLEYKNGIVGFKVVQEGTAGYAHELKLKYNVDKKNIQLVGYNFSYRTPGGHCAKTYDLLTGDYTVSNELFIINSEETKTEEFKGNKKPSKDIFINSFTSKLFGNLSSIGREYEKE